MVKSLGYTEKLIKQQNENIICQCFVHEWYKNLNKPYLAIKPRTLWNYWLNYKSENEEIEQYSNKIKKALDNFLNTKADDNDIRILKAVAALNQDYSEIENIMMSKLTKEELKQTKEMIKDPSHKEKFFNVIKNGGYKELTPAEAYATYCVSWEYGRLERQRRMAGINALNNQIAKELEKNRRQQRAMSNSPTLKYPCGH